MSGEVAQLTASLRDLGRPERAQEVKRYLKIDIEHLGVSMPDIRKVAKSFLKDHPELSHKELIALVTELWKKPVFERRALAVELLVIRGAILVPADMELIEHFLREAKTWALVDPLAVNVTGSLVERFPELNAVLDRWAEDDDFWIRRASMLTLLRPLRAGEGDFERFASYADRMLEEKEFFIRKAIGWVLREVSKKRPALVAEWLAPRAERASGVTKREAVKYLSEKQRDLISRP